MKKVFFIVLILAVLVLILFLVKSRNSGPNSLDNSPEKEGLSTYNASGFTFKYAKSAIVEELTTSLGEKLYLVSKPESVGESIKLINTSALSRNQYCGDAPIKETIMNGKEFSYCESSAEPATTYFYTKGAKTLIISVQGTIGGLSYTHIVPGSAEII